MRKSHSRWIFIAASPCEYAATAGELVAVLSRSDLIAGWVEQRRDQSLTFQKNTL